MDASGNIHLYTLSDQTFDRTITGLNGLVSFVAFSYDNTKLLGFSSSTNDIKVWDLSNSDSELATISNSGLIYSPVFSKDNLKMAYGSPNNEVKIYQVSDFTLAQTLTGHTNQVTAV